jgi:predicted permease
LGSALAPVALFAVGAGIMWANIKDYWKILSVMSFFKMIICPAIAYLVAVLLHLNNLETFALVLIAAVPSPKTAYILAEEYNFEPELMAGHIALTTVIGVVTIFGLILFASSVDPTLFKALPG